MSNRQAKSSKQQLRTHDIFIRIGSKACYHSSMSTEPASQPIHAQSIGTFLDALASKAPTPGGGASAALTGATAAATACMVLSYSIGKKKLANHDQYNTNANAQLIRARQIFLQLAQDDAAGYGELNALWGLDKDDPKRIERWDAAVQGAITPPQAMMVLGLKVLHVCESLINTTNTMLKSDLGVAAVLANAAARSAAWSVNINIPLLPEDQQQPMRDEVERTLGACAELCQSIEKGCA
jgi:formiminotetrahydrofolate cyclodeaminase